MVKRGVAYILSYLIIMVDQFQWILQDLEQIQNRMGLAGNDQRIKIARQSIIGSMEAFIEVWFRPIRDQAGQWTSVNSSTEVSGMFSFRLDERVQTSNECTYGDLLSTLTEKIQDLKVLLTMAAEDVGLESPSTLGPPSISRVPFFETLVSVLMSELLAQHGNMALSDRVKQSLRMYQATRTYIFPTF